jgi:glucosylceramidase
MLQQKHFKLSYDTQERFFKAYYDKDQGIGYTLGRTTIHSCDFLPLVYLYRRRR